MEEGAGCQTFWNCRLFAPRCWCHVDLLLNVRMRRHYQGVWTPTLNLVADIDARPNNETAERLLPAAENMPVVTRKSNWGCNNWWGVQMFSLVMRTLGKVIDLMRDPWFGPRLLGIQRLDYVHMTGENIWD
jgi:hypothetical protein